MKLTTKASYDPPDCCGQGKSVTVHANCVSSTSVPVHLAYVAWIAHWRTCTQCHAEDWYTPGGIRTHVEQIMADGEVRIHVRLPNGEDEERLVL